MRFPGRMMRSLRVVVMRWVEREGEWALAEGQSAVQAGSRQHQDNSQQQPSGAVGLHRALSRR